MKLEKILAISGKPGLYELKMQTRTGFVAESLLDAKKITVSLRSNVSLLSEISIYTYDQEKPLSEILNTIAIKQNYQPIESFKDDKAKLSAYFLEILPDYDQDRVYASDIKKVLNWYNLLQAKGIITPESETVKDVVEEQIPVTEVKSEKAKTTTTKKTVDTAEQEKPKKQSKTKTKE